MAWETEYSKNITNIEQLCDYTTISPSERKRLSEIIARHPMSVTRYYMDLIDWNDPDDPIRRMIIPSENELDSSGDRDASDEQSNIQVDGLQHKYERTALLLTTNRCTSFCRYCFRKRLVGISNREVLRKSSSAIEYIREHSEINNVLLSGGDPLCQPTKTVKRFIEQLFSIDHIEFVRIGTKVPVTMPQRIIEDGELIDFFHKYRDGEKQIFVNTHFNHPSEITPMAKKAISLLLEAGIIANNQTVLLKGVNDSPEVMAELQRSLINTCILPYYVFQCRPVKRVKKHFQVTLGRGYDIIEDAKVLLDGYSKRFRYVMSHSTGKIEIVGRDQGYLYFRYHQAKSAKDYGRFFKLRIRNNQCWLGDLKAGDDEYFVRTA